MNEERSRSLYPEFQGKTVVVYVHSRPGVPTALHECRFDVQGGRLFLSGVAVSGPQTLKEWTEGLRRSIAWDAVEEYLVFDSTEAYLARIQPEVAGNLQLLPDGNTLE